MKEKILKIFFISILFFVIIGMNEVLAIENNSDKYEIEGYNVEIVVNSNNSFEVTETITANFITETGIVRKIPLKYSVTRADGEKADITAKISNIEVSDNYSSSNKNGYKVIKIGQKNTELGIHEYTIKYTYNMGKDVWDDEDEFFFNIIGDEWDTNVKNITFSITMPDSFEKSKLSFTSGLSSNVSLATAKWNVSENVVSGSLKTGLSAGEALTIRIVLPEGYFTGYIANLDYLSIFEIGIIAILVLISAIFWLKSGRGNKTEEVIQSYPPKDLNSAEIAFIYKGYSEVKDVVSVLICLANKGYLKIVQNDNGSFKDRNSKEFKIIKLKEYDGKNKAEKVFFNDLFKTKSMLDKQDFNSNFYKTLKKISNNISKKRNVNVIFTKSTQKAKRITFIFALVIIFILLFDIFKGEFYFVKFVCEVLGIVLCFRFSMKMKKRTPYGEELLNNIEGFRKFLETASTEELQQLINEDSNYFYEILPYATVLKASHDAMEKFEYIEIEPPDWYESNSVVDVYTINEFMDITYELIIDNVTPFSKITKKIENLKSKFKDNINGVINNLKNKPKK